MKGTVIIRCDYGNPTGSGIAKLVVDNLESADVATALTDMDTFADSLKSGGFTAGNISDVSVVDKTIQFADKPAANVNADRQLIVSFRKKTDDTVRKLTISGIAADATVLEKVDAGERLTTSAKTTLEGYLDTLFG